MRAPDSECGSAHRRLIRLDALLARRNVRARPSIPRVRSHRRRGVMIVAKLSASPPCRVRDLVTAAQISDQRTHGRPSLSLYAALDSRTWPSDQSLTKGAPPLARYTGGASAGWLPSQTAPHVRRWPCRPKQYLRVIGGNEDVPLDGAQTAAAVAVTQAAADPAYGSASRVQPVPARRRQHPLPVDLLSGSEAAQASGASDRGAACLPPRFTTVKARGHPNPGDHSHLLRGLVFLVGCGLNSAGWLRLRSASEIIARTSQSIWATKLPPPRSHNRTWAILASPVKSIAGRYSRLGR